MTRTEVPPAEAKVHVHLQSGDTSSAATEAIRLFGPQILGYLAAILRNESDVNDVFSVFCEDLWRGIAGFRGDASLRTWAYKLAWHAAARFRRDPYRKRGRRLATDEVSAIAAEVGTRSATQAHLRDSAKDDLARLRASLEPDEQTLLILRVDRRMAWTEIAEVMGGDEGPAEAAALRKRFERLKDKLRKLAVAQGILTPK